MNSISTSFKTIFSQSKSNVDATDDSFDETDKEYKKLINESARGDYREPSAQIKYVRSRLDLQTSTSAEKSVNSKAPEPTIPEEDRKEDTSETADLTRDKAEETRQVESTEIQNHEKGIFDEISD